MDREVVSMISLLIALLLLVASGVLAYFTYFYTFMQQDKTLAIVCFSLFALGLALAMLAIFTFVTRKTRAEFKKLNIRLKKWRDISYHANKAGDEAFNKLPIGILLYDVENATYMTTWANGFAKDVFQSELNDVAIESISEALLSFVIEGKELFTFEYNDKSYDVIHNIENKILYIHEVTEREAIKKRYNERITAIGIIELDNLEESLKRFDMQEKANFRGEILGKLSDWISEYHCHLQSITGDRMMIVLDKEALLQMMENKFQILSDVREIAQKNRLKSSISMGIACYDCSYDELGSIAQNAIELAIKRGGDQIVVNLEGEAIQFFGGNTNSLEKNSLVEARMQTMALKEAVEGSTNVLLMCHNLADCDALGSMIGVFRMIESSTEHIKMVFDENKADITVKKIFEGIKEKPNLYKNFIGIDEALELCKPTTLLIITDTQSPALVMFRELLDKAERLSIIDHHRAGDKGYSNYLSYYVESSASSSVELVTEMFMFYSSNINISKHEASIMLSGIVVDTNNFTMRSGTRTFEAAATLKSLGADMIYVRRLLQEPLETEKLLAEALTGAEVYGERFGIACLDESQHIGDRTTLAKISDKQLTIEGVEASFTIGRISETEVGISARSLGDSINVQVIMEQMGGGGHFNSAASQIKNVSIKEVRDQLVEILRLEHLEGGNGVMKVILTQDVKGKGKKDQIIDVANGYANYLINNNLAVAATEENMVLFEKQKEAEKKAEENRRAVLKKIRDDINGKLVTLKIKLGAGGKVFGHITTKLVCDEFEAQTGIHLDKRKVEIPADINSIGIFTATVKLESDIIASFEIKVEEEK